MAGVVVVVVVVDALAVDEVAVDAVVGGGRGASLLRQLLTEGKQSTLRAHDRMLAPRRSDVHSLSHDTTCTL